MKVFMINLIDKTFSIIADIILKVLPVNRKEKKAFYYYRLGMNEQISGNYQEAIDYYHKSLLNEEDPYDRGYTLYNIGLIYQNLGEFEKSITYYKQSISLNPSLSQALHNLGTIYHKQASIAEQEYFLSEDKRQEKLSNKLYNEASELFKRAIRLAPNIYLETENWLKTSQDLYELKDFPSENDNFFEKLKT